MSSKMVFTDLIFTDVYLPLEQFFFMWLVIFYSIVCAVTSFHGFPYRAYRALYILNWAYRFLVEDNHHYHWIRKFWVLLHIDSSYSQFLNFISCMKTSLTCYYQMPNTAWISGLVQTALYADFFYYYFKRYIFHVIYQRLDCLEATNCSMDLFSGSQHSEYLHIR